MIGHPAAPTDPIPPLQGLRQVFNCPVLSAGRVRILTQYIARTVRSQLVSHFLKLTAAQFRAHRPTSMVGQSSHTLRPVFTTPFHQACPIAACDPADFLNPIRLSIQPNRLIAGPFCAVPAFPIGPLQLLFLFLRQFKPSSCHPFIVRLCSEFSLSAALLKYGKIQGAKRIDVVGYSNHAQAYCGAASERR